MIDTAKDDFTEKGNWTISDLVNYHQTVRDAIKHFEVSATRILLQGIPVVGALMSLSAFLIDVSDCAAVWVLVGSIVFTAILAILSLFYIRLLKSSVDTATQLEDIMFASSDNDNIFRSADNKKLKLTKNIDANNPLAGKNEWVLVGIFFVGPTAVELILLIFYLMKMGLC